MKIVKIIGYIALLSAIFGRKVNQVLKETNILINKAKILSNGKNPEKSRDILPWFVG